MEKSESDSLDWKSDFASGILGGRKDSNWDKDRARLLKSVVAIANSNDNNFGFLVYGVKDHKTQRELIGISKSFDDADFQQWFENIFDVPPKFTYREIEIESGINIGIFNIHRTPSYPHVVKTDLGDTLYRGQVWYKRGTKNTVALKTELSAMFQSIEPFKIGTLRDPSLKMVTDFYSEQGRNTSLPRLSDRDSCLARGYELAYYPGTNREVWCGESDGRYEHILLLKPSADV